MVSLRETGLARSKNPLLVRADASARIGTGHVMRMLALAQAWQDEFHSTCVTFAGSELPPALHDRLIAEGIEVWRIESKAGGAADAREIITRSRARGVTPSWVVADGYFFTAEFQQELRAVGRRLAVMDDNGEIGTYDSNVILNQNIMARESMYARRNLDARLLLGTKYALLRREFRAKAHQPKRVSQQVERVMVTFGGSDTVELVIAVVEILREIRPLLHIRCVLGSLAGATVDLKKMQANSPHRVEILHNVHDMTDVMGWADISINAAGSTTWELCAMGVPMILTVLAENQRRIAETLVALGCAVSAGDVAVTGATETVRDLFLSLAGATQRRSELANHAHELVDGRGASRVVKALTENEDN